MADDRQDKISDATKEAERRDAQAQAGAPQQPTPEEEAAAARAGGPSDSTREHYGDMVEKGANQQGEGRIP